MPARSHYLICYDISSNNNRYQAYHHLQAYAVGKQKSGFSCWLTLAERQKLQQQLLALLKPEDALLIVGLGNRYEAQYHGQAQPLEYPVFIIS